MMIGREDIIIPTHGGRAALDAAIHAVRHYWPDAAVEDPLTGERRPLALARSREIFVYQREEFVNQWEDLGCVPELSNTMIHLLIDDDELTVVIDEPEDAQMKQILAAIRSALAAIEPAMEKRAIA